MKKRLAFFVGALIFLLLLLPVQAEEAAGTDLDELLSEQLEASGAKELERQAPQAAAGIMEELGLGLEDWRQLLALTPGEFLAAVGGIITEAVRAPVKLFGVLLGVVVLCAFIDGMKLSFGSRDLDTVFHAVAVLCTAGAVLEPVIRCVERTAGSIGECSRFMTAFIPVFSGVVAAGGQPVTAGVYRTVLFAVSQLVGQFAAGTLVPFICIYLAFCFTASLSPGLRLEEAAKAVRTCVTWTMGFVLTVYVGILGLQSMVASGGDNLTYKTTKFLLGNFVPVVGGALSDAFGTAQGCLRMLKNWVGAYGVAVGAFTFLPVLLEAAVWYGALQLAALSGDMLGAGKISAVLRAAGTALGLLLSLTLVFGLLFIVTITIMLLTASGG
jgi:stage III sporulation protein AE